MRERLAVCGFCAAVTVLALAAAGWIVFSGQIALQGIDALFFLFVCLAAALIFGMIPAAAVRRELLRRAVHRASASPQPERRAAAALSPKPQERAE